MPLAVRCGLHAGPVHSATTTTSAARSTARRASWGSRTAARCSSRRRSPTCSDAGCPRKLPSRPRRGAPKGPGEHRARLPARASRPAGRVPRAAIARGNAQQPSAAAYVLHWSRARDRGSRGPARAHATANAAGHRRRGQDAARPSNRGRLAGFLSGRRVVRRPRADTRAAFVATDTAKVLGIARNQAGRSSKTLCAHLKTRTLLLILDNCEHLVEPRRTCDAILRAAPNVRIIATSREPLRVPGEQVYTVLPLPAPESFRRHRGAVAITGGQAVRRAREIRTSPLSRSTNTRPPQWPNWLHDWRAYHSRSSSPPHECARSRSPTSTHGSRIATSC